MASLVKPLSVVVVIFVRKYCGKVVKPTVRVVYIAHPVGIVGSRTLSDIFTRRGPLSRGGAGEGETLWCTGGTIQPFIRGQCGVQGEPDEEEVSVYVRERQCGIQGEPDSPLS